MHIFIKKQLIKQFLEGLGEELERVVDKSPEEWDGVELRWLLRDKAAEYVWYTMVDKRSKRYKNYKNFCLINNL